MKHIVIAGNWKSNKTVTEADNWIRAFAPKIESLHVNPQEVTVIVFAPFSDLYILKKEIDTYVLPLSLGAQDISPYSEGAYTGEESARMIRELGQWVLIGHSERRKYQKENDEELFAEVARAKEGDLKVLYCVPDSQTRIPPGVDVVGYEPVWAIGSGKAELPEEANKTIEDIKSKTGVKMVVYGGSVTAENVRSYIDQPSIDGILPGGASLDPDKFIALIEGAIR